MSLGSYVVSGSPYFPGLSNSTLVFQTVNFDPPGLALDQLIDQQEEMSDVGVDYRRWRLINKEFRAFRMQTTASFATYTDGIAEQRRYQISAGSIGDLNATLNGASYRWKNVKILDCVPRLFTGKMVGTGVDTSLAVITAEWSIVLTRTAGNA